MYALYLVIWVNGTRPQYLVVVTSDSCEINNKQNPPTVPHNSNDSLIEINKYVSMNALFINLYVFILIVGGAQEGDFGSYLSVVVSYWILNIRC